VKRKIFLLAIVLIVITPSAVFSADAQKKEITITTWNLEDGTWKPFWLDDFKAFEAANPQYTVTELLIPYEQYWDKVITLVASGSPPDIVGENNVFLPVLINAKRLLPLNKYLDLNMINTEYFQTDVNQKDGNLYGLPFGGRTMQLLYNTKLLASKGVKVPTTHDELLAAAQKLTDKNAGVYGFALQTNTSNYDDTYENIETFVRSFGGSFARNGQPTATDPKTIEGVKFFKKMFDLGVSPISVSKNTIRELFYAEKVAMFIDGPWLPVFFDQANPAAKGRISAAQNPWQNKAASGGIRYFFTIPRNAKNPDGAALYLKWTTAPQWHRTISKVSGVPGGRKDSITPDLLKEKPFLNVYLEGMAKYAFSEAPQGFETQAIMYMKEVVNALGEILYDKRGVEDTMNKLQKSLLELKAEM